MNEYERLRRQAEVLRDMYPPGSRVECLYMNDPFAPVPSGTNLFFYSQFFLIGNPADIKPSDVYISGVVLANTSSRRIL